MLGDLIIRAIVGGGMMVFAPIFFVFGVVAVWVQMTAWYEGNPHSYM